MVSSVGFAHYFLSSCPRIMDISTAYIEERFHHFNILCYGGRLVMPPIRLSRSRRALGQVRFMRRRRGGKVEFSNFDFAISVLLARDLCEQEVEDTILHEMIHYYILSNQLQDSSAHGVLFKSEMQRINHTFNRHITISHRSSSPVEQGNREKDDARMNVVAVLRLPDNRWGVMVVARTRVLQLWNQLERVPGLKQVLWFLSDDSFFSRLPRRTTLKYYPMEASELLDRLSSARILVRKGNNIMVNGCDIKTLIR